MDGWLVGARFRGRAMAWRPELAAARSPTWSSTTERCSSTSTNSLALRRSFLEFDDS